MKLLLVVIFFELTLKHCIKKLSFGAITEQIMYTKRKIRTVGFVDKSQSTPLNLSQKVHQIS